MNERLRPEQVTFYHENGFLGPIDLLSQDEVAEVRRHVEEVEAKLGAKMMSRFRIKAHLPFPFLCDLVSHPKLLDAVEDLIGPNVLCWGSSFFQKEPEDKTFVSWHQDFDVLRSQATQHADRVDCHIRGLDRRWVHAFPSGVAQQGHLQPR